MHGLMRMCVCLLFCFGIIGCGHGPNDDAGPAQVLNGSVLGVTSGEARHIGVTVTFVLEDGSVCRFANMSRYGHKYRLIGPAGAQGMAARLKAAQKTTERITVDAIPQINDGFRIRQVRFPDGTTYHLRSIKRGAIQEQNWYK